MSETGGNAILSNNADEIAALVTVVIGACIGGYMLVTGTEFNESSVAVLTMFVATPMGYLFGKK